MVKYFHTRFLILCTSIIVLVVMVCPPASAQESQLWLTYFNQKAISPKWDILSDINHRRTGHFTNYNSTQAIRIGVNYNQSAQQTFAGGYAWFLTNNQSKMLDGLHENRIWQQWRLRIPVGKAGFVHRVRLEQRWRLQQSEGGYAQTFNDFSLRYRYYTHWQQGFTARSPLSWIAATEIMLQSGANIKNTMNQWRLLAGLNIKSGVHTEWLLAYQYIQLPDAQIFANGYIHTIRLTCSQIFAYKPRRTK